MILILTMAKPDQTLITLMVTIFYQEIAKSWQMSRLEDDVYSFGLILLQSIVGPSVSAREEAFLRDELVPFSNKTGLVILDYSYFKVVISVFVFRHRWRARKEGEEW